MTSPDVAIAKTEKFDVNTIKHIFEHDGVGADTKKLLRAYVKKAYNGNRIDVVYQHGKKSRLDEAGRLYPKCGLGLASMWKDVRNALAAKYYHDVDIVNSQPTLANNIAEKEGLKHEYLQDYINNREERLAELSDDRDENKRRVLAMFYGSKNTDALSPFWVKCYEDIQRVMKFVYMNADEADRKRAKKEKPNNAEGSTCAIIMQREEEKVLMALDKSLAEQERCLAVLIHDGGLVERLADELLFPSEILQQCEVRIKELTGYEIRLAVKPMVSTLVFPEPEEIVDDYPELKKEFEKSYFKLMDPPCYVCTTAGKIQMLNDQQLNVKHRNMYCKDESVFLTRWRADKDIRTYQNLVFMPKQEPPEGSFNIFTDFPCEAVEGDVSLPKELMFLLSGENKEVCDYLENYFAHLIQKPYDKAGVSLVFYTSKQGAGKDTLIDFIGNIIGSEYYFNTENPQETVFGRFTEHLQKTLLLKMEEVEFETNKKNESALLSLITANTRSYEGKGQKPVTLRDYKRIVMTTNKGNPVNIPDSDRRFVLVESSERRVGDREFWDKTYAELAKPETAKAYYYYLLNKDLTGFNIRNRPETNFYREVKSRSTPYHAVFFQNIIATFGDHNTELKWSSSELAARMTDGSKYPVTFQKMGRDIKIYPESALSKVKGRYNNEYVMNVEGMHHFLTGKGWWADS